LLPQHTPSLARVQLLPCPLLLVRTNAVMCRHNLECDEFGHQYQYSLC